MATTRKTVQYTSGGLQKINVTKTRTVTGNSGQLSTLTITQAGEIEYTFPTDVGDAHELVIENKDATNFIKLGFATGLYVIWIYPNDAVAINVDPTEASVFMIADTADCEALVVVDEE